MLDIEHSVLISDSSLPALVQFTQLSQLSIAKTKLSAQGQAKIILSLDQLQSLPRGDFLCDALGRGFDRDLYPRLDNLLYLDWVAWEEAYQQKPHPRFRIKNFWASEVYFFHSTEQMLLVSEMCPDIEEMLFMYQDQFTCSLSVLERFEKLARLELWGGDFYLDNFHGVLSSLGPRLTRLDLHHVENINLTSISTLSRTCPLLTVLKFSGCTFYLVDVPVGSFIVDNIDHDYNQSHQSRIINEIKSGLIPFLSLEEVSISSPCPEEMLVILLSLCLNIKTLAIGSMCEITDQCFDQILASNKLQHLGNVEIRKSEFLTMKTLSNLLLYCDNIKSVLDVQGWAGVEQADLEELVIHMKQNNIDILLREEEKDSRCVRYIFISSE